MLIEPNLKHISQIELVQTNVPKHGEHKGQTCGQYVVTTTDTPVSLPNMYIYDPGARPNTPPSNKSLLDCNLMYDLRSDP